MKFIPSITLLALAAALLAPSDAKAGDTERAVIGGLIGGIIIASVLDDDANVSVGYSSHYGRHDDGHWEWVSVRTWVPGYYERRRDHCGNLMKVWVSGHYTLVKQRVWVDTGHRRGHSNWHYGYRSGHRDRDYCDEDRRGDWRDRDHRRGGDWRDHDRRDDRRGDYRRGGSYDKDRGGNDHRQRFARGF